MLADIQSFLGELNEYRRQGAKMPQPEWKDKTGGSGQVTRDIIEEWAKAGEIDKLVEAGLRGQDSEVWLALQEYLPILQQYEKGLDAAKKAQSINPWEVVVDLFKGEGIASIGIDEYVERCNAMGANITAEQAQIDLQTLVDKNYLAEVTERSKVRYELTYQGAELFRFDTGRYAFDAPALVGQAAAGVGTNPNGTTADELFGPRHQWSHEEVVVNRWSDNPSLPARTTLPAVSAPVAEPYSSVGSAGVHIGTVLEEMQTRPPFVEQAGAAVIPSDAASRPDLFALPTPADEIIKVAHEDEALIPQQIPTAEDTRYTVIVDTSLFKGNEFRDDQTGFVTPEGIHIAAADRFNLAEADTSKIDNILVHVKDAGKTIVQVPYALSDTDLEELRAKAPGLRIVRIDTRDPSIKMGEETERRQDRFDLYNMLLWERRVTAEDIMEKNSVYRKAELAVKMRLGEDNEGQADKYLRELVKGVDDAMGVINIIKYNLSYRPAGRWLVPERHLVTLVTLSA